MKVYLAGGFKSGWQDTVIEECPEMEFLDPRSHNLKKPSEYTEWDLNAIKECRCVFAYMEASNPGGYALTLEIGYAKALGKIIILVDQAARGYFDMVHVVSDFRCFNLMEGIHILEYVNELNRPNYKGRDQ